MASEAQTALFAAAEAATHRLAAAGKNATPEMAAEATSLLTKWLDTSKAESAKRWADIAARFPAGGGAALPPKTVFPKGMSVGSAVLGTIAIGGGVYLASKIFSKPKERHPNWTDRVMAERASPSAQILR